MDKSRLIVFQSAALVDLLLLVHAQLAGACVDQQQEATTKTELVK